MTMSASLSLDEVKRRRKLPFLLFLLLATLSAMLSAMPSNVPAGAAHRDTHAGGQSDPPIGQVHAWLYKQACMPGRYTALAPRRVAWTGP